MRARQIVNEARQFIRCQLPLGELPQHVFVVGAQKAGTSALYSYLAKHPMIVGGVSKELGFFSDELMFKKGADRYRSLFPIWTNGTHALDATPEYMYYKKCAERIYAFRSDAKIVIILREPVSRAFSAFNMYLQISRQKWFKERLRRADVDTRDFFLSMAKKDGGADIRHLLDRELKIIGCGGSEESEPTLIRRGIYAPQLGRFIRLFGRENVLILFSDDLKRAPEKVVNRVLGAIGLDPLTDGIYPMKNVLEYTVDTSGMDEIRRYAGEIFEKDKQELINVYGLQVPW